MEQNNRRTQYLVLAVFAAIAIVVALVVISQSGGGDDDGGGGNPSDIKGVAEVESELSGLDQAGTVLGDANAPITVTEFGDPQCPICADFSKKVAPDLISTEVKPGSVKFDYRPWLIIGPDSDPAAKAALAAAEQNRFWNYIQLFYANQGAENSGYVTDEFLTSIAEAAKVPDLDQWNTDRTSDMYDAQLKQNDQDATSLGFTGTPSILVEGPRGKQPLQGFSLEEIEAAINQASG